MTRRLDLSVLALAGLLVATSIARFSVYPTRPLWLDEVWTGMVVTQPSLGDFIRQCTLDVNGPLYSILAALWARVSGVSDPALRFLPAALGVTAPLIALAPGWTPDRSVRFVWCALLACWIPGLLDSLEARPYTLVLALAVANTIAFARAMDDPRTRNVWAWTGVSALFVLAHYFDALVVLAQGLTFLAVHRLRAVRAWPAALAFLPVAATLGMQLRSLSTFASAGTTWISPLDWPGAYSDVAFLFGLPALALTTGLWLAAAVVVGRRAPPISPRLFGPWVAAGCAAGAVVAAFALGLARPILVDRYLFGFAPGLLLGLTLIARRHARAWALATPALLAPYVVMAGVWAISPHPLENRYSWERASQALIAEKIDRLVFFWDSAVGGEPSSERGLGAFFFARAGHPVPVDPVILAGRGEDPNPVIVEKARAEGTGVLWIYDRMVRGAAAQVHPPALQRLDPGLSCRDFGDDRFGILACRQTGRGGDAH